MKHLWSKVSARLYGIITVAGVNCIDNDVLCDEFEAYGCPAIFVAPANIESEYIKYQGEDKFGKIASFAVKHMENFAQIVNELNYERFISEQQNKMKVNRTERHGGCQTPLWTGDHTAEQEPIKAHRCISDKMLAENSRMAIDIHRQMRNKK